MSRKWWNSFKELFVLVCFLAGMLQLRTFSYWIADWFSFLWDQLGTPLEQLLICGVPTKKGSPQTLQGAICQELWTKKVFVFCCCMFFLRHTRSNKNPQLPWASLRKYHPFHHPKGGEYPTDSHVVFSDGRFTKVIIFILDQILKLTASSEIEGPSFVFCFRLDLEELADFFDYISGTGMWMWF